MHKLPTTTLSKPTLFIMMKFTTITVFRISSEAHVRTTTGKITLRQSGTLFWKSLGEGRGEGKALEVKILYQC